VEAMKAIWTEEEAEYHGEFVDFDPIWQWPKPVQKPHPPVMIGGMGDRVAQRVRDYGSGWFPQPGRMPDDDGFVERVAAHRGEFEMSAFGAKAKPDVIERYEEAGISRTVFWIPPAGRDETDRYLDGLQQRLGR